MATKSPYASSSDVAGVPPGLGTGSGLSPSQIASWSLTPPIPDPDGTFVDVLELTEDDLRWLRERPTDPDLDLDLDLDLDEEDPVSGQPSGRTTNASHPSTDGSPAHAATASRSGWSAAPAAGPEPAGQAAAEHSSLAAGPQAGKAFPSTPGTTPPTTGMTSLAAEQPFWATPGVTPPSVPDPVSPRLAAAQDAVGALLAGGALSGSRADTEALLRLAEQAQTAALVELAEMDATGGHLRQDLRGTTTATWLRDTLRISDPVARSTVRLAVALRDELPELGAAVVQGQITVEHARAALDGVRKLDPQIVTDAADGILALASLVDPPSLRRTLRDKAIAIDPKLAEEAARRAEARQGIRVAEVGDHTAIDGTLAGEAGVVLRLALDLATEKARVEGDTRGKAARTADVIIGWATQDLAGHGPGDSLRDDAHTVRTHVHVLVTPDQLAAAAAQINGAGQRTSTGNAISDGTPDGACACDRGPGAPTGPTSLAELLDADLLGQHAPAAPVLIGSSNPLTLGALRRLTCDATIHLTVQRDLTAARTNGERTGHDCAERPPGAALGTPPPPGWVCSHLRDPLYVGRSSRTVTGAIFKALIARDRRCVVKGCHRPPSACEAHHVEWWANGGGTHLGNMVLLCHAHHHDLHDRAQQLPHHDGIRWLTETGWASDPP